MKSISISKGGNGAEYRKYKTIYVVNGRKICTIRDKAPDSEEAVALAKKLQDHITENYYTCTDKILQGLGMMYAGGGDFTTNIDKFGGEGTAVFACEAIKAMIAKK